MSYSDSIFRAINNRVNQIHTTFPAKVVSVSKDGYTVDVKPMIRNKDRQYPVLFDVPFLTPSIGNKGLFFSPEIGDELLISCSESDFYLWYETGESSPESNMKRHDLSNAVAMMGFDSNKNKRAMKKDEALAIEADKSSIVIKKDGEIVINNGKDYLVKFSDLKSILDSVIKNYNAHTHAVVNEAATPTPSQVIANINSFKVEDVRI
jgi:hypothetical protein